MQHQLFLSTPSISIFTFFFISLFCVLPISYSQDVETFTQCFSTFDCGNLKNLTFPFWTEDRDEICRQEGFKLTKCGEDPEPVIDIGGNGNEFRLIYFNQSTHTMTMARNDLWENICLSNRINVTLGYPFLHYPETNRNLTFFYDCNSSVTRPVRTECNQGLHSFYADDLVERDSYEYFRSYCPGGAIQVQVNQIAFAELQIEGPEMLRSRHWRLGFDVAYRLPEIICSKCDSLKGKCENISSTEHPICRRTGDDLNLDRRLMIGFSTAAVGVIIACIAFYIWLRCRRGKGVFKSSFETGGKSSSDRSFMMDSEKGGCYGGIHLFTYNELEEATNNFDSDRELGSGGFGTVYYGKLRDGRAIAVKRLYEDNYKRVEQFMNEVEILTRLRHQNLVALYGCTSRHSRELLLVYEYVPNGTVADHLHGEHAKPGALSWHIRLEIAIQTANALRYLHASDIIHRDVKTNNILLDNNFTVKVADFGLSRPFPTDVTHVSTAPQGTPGYVDPEYYQCYQLTDKSDVFSFGVVLIELISSKLAVDITRHCHEIHLSNMAINKIQNGALHELVDPSLGFKSNHKVRKMVNAVAGVAFQCLQSEKDMRPTMAQVLEELIVGYQWAHESI